MHNWPFFFYHNAQTCYPFFPIQQRAGQGFFRLASQTPSPIITQHQRSFPNPEYVSNVRAQSSPSPTVNDQPLNDSSIHQGILRQNTKANETYKKPLKRGKRVPKADLDYDPVQKQIKKAKRSHGNQNRNILANLINQLFSFLQHKNRSQLFLNKLFQKYEHQPSFTQKRFYLYQSQIKANKGNYTNQSSIKLLAELADPQCSRWKREEQLFYLKLTSILVRLFFQKFALNSVITSTRIAISSKRIHIQSLREIQKTTMRILQNR